MNTTSSAVVSEPSAQLLTSNMTPTLHPSVSPGIGGDHDHALKWYLVLEAVLLGILTIVGLVGNAVVMQGSIKAKRFAKQNVYLFFGLSLSDFSVCLIRGPSLVFVLFHTSGSPDVICELWVFSGIFVFISILMNMVLAVERRMIMYNFQRYLYHFTPRRVLYISIIIWISVPLLFIAVYVGFLFRAKFHQDDLTCYLDTNIIDLNQMTSTLFRVITLVSCGLIPICIKAFCHVAIVLKIFKAELLKLDRIHEKATYTRIIRISFARVSLIITCILPALVCFAVGPLFPNVYFSYVRFLDYLLILRSVISPFISMYDTDFRETFVKRKKRFCSTFKTRYSSKKISRRSFITSAELKTVGPN